MTRPNVTLSRYAAAHPLLLTGPAYADLGKDLEARGLHYVNTDLPTGVSMEDGRTAVLPRSLEALLAEAERLAPGDGTALARMFENLHPYVNEVFGLFNVDLATPAAAAVMARLMGNPTFAALMFSTARTVVSPFQSPVMRALLAPWVMHLGRTPDDIGSGIWVPLTAMALMGGGMPTPAGGSERLAQALAQLVVDQGGILHTHTLVQHIIVEHGRAVGVRTADGHTFRAAQAVVACTTPDHLYLSLLAETAIDPPLRQQAAQFRYGRGCVQIHLALSEPPRWPDARFHKVGQPHLTDGLDGCTLAVAQGRADLVPVKPTFTVDCATNLDPTRAPAGHAIMRVQVLEVPIRPRGDAAGQIDVGDGTWTPALTERFTARVLEVVRTHIPNIPSAVLGHHVITPDAIAQFNPNAGPGDPYGGAHDLAQSYTLRPLPSQPSHQTPVPNLYMLGAATWPGHEIHGGSGYIVARKLLAADGADKM